MWITFNKHFPYLSDLPKTMIPIFKVRVRLKKLFEVLSYAENALIDITSVGC